MAANLTEPLPGECLLCYVARMLEQFGCLSTLRFATRYRDLCAPRATALEWRLGQRGGFCDCGIFWNGYQPTWRVLDAAGWVCPSPEHSPGYCEECVNALSTVPLPLCRGVRKGSTQGCQFWAPIRRGR